MLLGILSDTHGFFHPALPEVLRGAHLILHAGDVGGLEILERLKEIAPVQAVYGNIDGPELRRRLPEQVDLTLEGLRFWMTHIGGHPGRWARGVGPKLRKDRPDVFICGHSHILQIERVPSLGGMLYINPGAAGREGPHRIKTCVRLYVAEGRALKAEVVHLDEEKFGT
uniref:Phosphoesterase n=1 Tax=Rhodothermus marinus TaxID=29549 RepID=A0A7V2B1G0_RHOMR